ncbi:gliding motility-associated C-terminal domain-containing protein [Mucilaginibacter terrae]|uniref:gliding motility-associated C-terminal domain-containing protein n=1 Tax=Mucilaginibacter terrae TaxID=1955052 RepID=UPI00362AB62A
MKLGLFALLLIISNVYCRAQTGFSCQQAINLTQLSNFCSNANQYSNTDLSQNGQTWFKFTATKTDVNITVKGNKADSLFIPVLTLSQDCLGGSIVGSLNTIDNISTYYKGGLTVSSTYYIKVNDANGNKGSFQLCINNFSSPVQAGQDCSTALYLCNNSTFRQNVVSGAGISNNESAGTCMGGTESNSVWYKWRAATSGPLVFTITPDKTTDDIDFVLYDLGTSDNCANANAANVLRCAAGHGVDNSSCPNEPLYYKTGLSFTETDVSEQSGCGSGQNGMLRYLDMQEGHYYALLINNFTSINAGLTLSFADQNGVGGTSTFASPDADIEVSLADSCLANRTYYVKNNSANYTDLKWDFGSGAQLIDVDATGKYTVYYSSPGIKNITLTATNDIGCSALTTKPLDVPVVILPEKPVIVINQNNFCIGDVMELSVTEQPGINYRWTGPDNYSATSAKVSIPVTSMLQAGTYNVTAYLDYCPGETSSIEVTGIYNKPVATFTTDPKMGTKLDLPVSITFNNRSLYADRYLWDFGDGSTSTLENPVHQYTKPGSYYIRLFAFNNFCSSFTVQGQYVVDAENIIFIPNTFTPNADGVNDLFGVSISNINTYQLIIYTRWGQQVFQSRDPLKKWDGTYGNNQMPTGTYYYILTATGLKGNYIKNSGFVTLIR